MLRVAIVWCFLLIRSSVASQWTTRPMRFKKVCKYDVVLRWWFVEVCGVCTL
ncbi:hypothetical protein Hdeb2414_s0008g00266561 [Helianthus debilis subsp. tardiflorus]